MTYISSLVLTWLKASRGDIAVSYDVETVTVERLKKGRLVLDGQRIDFEKGTHVFRRKVEATCNFTRTENVN